MGHLRIEQCAIDKSEHLKQGLVNYVGKFVVG
jgi:hypothetical protein